MPTEAHELQAAGFAVFDVNYDTMPRSYGAFPLEIDDVVSATSWAIEHAAAYGANPSNVEMIGGSAGGQLVAMAAEALNARKSHTVSSIVTLSGALDFVLKIEDIQDGVVKGYDAVHAQEALGCWLKDDTCTQPLEKEWSATKNVTRANCPMDSLIINGNHESEPVDQADSMTYGPARQGLRSDRGDSARQSALVHLLAFGGSSDRRFRGRALKIRPSWILESGYPASTRSPWRLAVALPGTERVKVSPLLPILGTAGQTSASQVETGESAIQGASVPCRGLSPRTARQSPPESRQGRSYFAGCRLVSRSPVGCMLAISASVLLADRRPEMDGEPFTMVVTKSGDTSLVRLSGELDIASTGGLTEALSVMAGATVVDLSGLTFIDSSGVAALVRSQQQLTAKGHSLTLTRPSTSVSRVFEILGITFLLEADPKS